MLLNILGKLSKKISMKGMLTDRQRSQTGSSEGPVKEHNSRLCQEPLCYTVAISRPKSKYIKYFNRIGQDQQKIVESELAQFMS